MTAQAKVKEAPTARKTYVDPTTGGKKQGALLPLAKIRADIIWQKVGPYLKQYEIFGNRLVVAVFKNEKTKEILTATGETTTLYMPDEFVEEDVWQGVTGLVVQVGPTAFQDSDKWKFGGQKAEINDWVSFLPSNTILQKFGSVYDGVEIRIIQDCYIISKVDGPHVLEERTHR